MIFTRINVRKHDEDLLLSVGAVGGESLTEKLAEAGQEESVRLDDAAVNAADDAHVAKEPENVEKINTNEAAVHF